MRSLTSRASGLAGVTAAIALFVQILVHRIVSAKLMNNYAFLVISLTMLGFALSGVILSRWREPLLAAFEDWITALAALFVLATLASTAVFYHLDVGHQLAFYRRDFLLHLFRWASVALPFTLPFTFCGLILGMLLSDPRLLTRRVYFFDLLGSGLGAIAVIPAISRLGVEWSLLLACGVMLGAALVLAPPRRAPARALALGAAVALALVAARSAQVFDMRYPESSPLAQVQRLPKPYGIEYIAWDPVTRIEISRTEPPDDTKSFTPSLIGPNREFHQRFLRSLTQNNWAFAYAIDYDGQPSSLKGIEETVYSAAYHASSVAHPRVLTIGVGGGFDVLTALAFDPREVTGVEVNDATIDILRRVYRDYFRNWVDDPRVRLVGAEGRHYLATTGDRYDVIQLSGVDSYSGTPGAVHVFAENYLYTSEAFALYLDHLGPDGILNMMRVEYALPCEMLRVLITAVGALRQGGSLHPADHLMVLAEPSGHYVSVLVKKTPFTAAEVERSARWTSTNPYLRVVAAPGRNHPDGNMYERFLTLDDPAAEAQFVAAYPLNVAPVDDNRPFFFRASFWWHLFVTDPVVREYTLPVLEYTLLALFGVIAVAGVVCVFLPLRVLAGQGLRVPGIGRYAFFFGAIGLGYLAVEMALIQKFGLFLGHPNYALSVVLASLLMSSGLGAAMSAWTVGRLGGIRAVSYVLAGLVIASYFGLPRVTAAMDWPYPARVLAVIAVVAPIGLCLGAFLPAGLEQLKGTAPAFVPWAWGLNGIFSVLAPVLSVGVSVTFGINALLLSAVPVYLAAGLSLPSAGGSAEPGGA